MFHFILSKIAVRSLSFTLTDIAWVMNLETVYERTSFTAYQRQHSLKSPAMWQQHKFKFYEFTSFVQFAQRTPAHQLYFSLQFNVLHSPKEASPR